MISSVKLEETIHRLIKDPNDLESAIKILNSSFISHCFINAGRVDVVSIAIKCVLNYLNSPTNRSVTETRRENVTLKKELENKDKMIDLMINVINDSAICDYFIKENCENYLSGLTRTCNICIREYFEKKVEESK